jgi:hypothetical protein
LHAGQSVGAQLVRGHLICEQSYDFVGEILWIIRQQHVTILCKIQPVYAYRRRDGRFLHGHGSQNLVFYTGTYA